LRDTSFIYCEQVQEKIQFDNFYMLSHGDIWYDKYGFIPFDPIKNTVDYKAQINVYEDKKKLTCF
jgi:hypothetical protein